ncbi:MAG: PhzF family phenazine biosynthesis protein [Hyphomicrobiaceae bacterium]
MDFKFHTLDVFTDTRFSGNPLAVVEEADALTTEQMQAIAHEFNLPETIFIRSPKKPGHSASVRIFTPTNEIPFAGHPTIGVAILLAHLTAPNINGEQDALIVLEEEIGTVRVGVRLASGEPAYGEFRAPKLPLDAGALPEVDRIGAAIGLIPSEIGFENHKPTCFAAGNAFAFVPVATLSAMRKAAVQPLGWADAFEQQGLVGVYLYTRQCEHTDSAFHSRMFAPGMGVPEDAATGSAAVCLAGVIQKFDMLRDGTHRRRIEQGYEMGRPSHIDLTIVVEGGVLNAVRIGGNAVRLAHGTLTVDV